MTTVVKIFKGNSETARKTNKIWVDKGGEFCNR